MKHFVRNRAFSMIEFCVITLIVAMMIYGIFVSLDYVARYKLDHTRSLTKNSPVGKVADLALWLEPVMEDSFNNSEPEDGDAVSLWNDINTQIISKINYTQNDTNKQPVYVRDGIGGMPSLLFDGDDELEAMMPPIMAGKDQYTIFVIWQQDSDALGKQVLFQQEGDDCDGDFVGLYVASNNINGFTCDDNNDVQATNYVPGKAYITAYRSDDRQSNNVSIYVNGQEFGPMQRYVNIGSVASGIGYGDDNHFKGMIAEVIIYNRALLPVEMNDIGGYLRSKYGIY